MEALQQLTRLDIPQGARRVAASGQDLLVRVREQAAAHVRRVRADRLLACRNIFFASDDRINRHFVVKAAKSEIVLFVTQHIQSREKKSSQLPASDGVA